jgi:hypothetical protein
VEALEHGPRFVPGTLIRVTANEVVDLGIAPPVDPAASQAALDKAMAQGRENLPTVQELLAKAKPQESDLVRFVDGPLRQMAPIVPLPPPPDLTATSANTPTTPQGKPEMSKLSELAGLAATATKDIEAEADRVSNRLNAARAKAFTATAKIDGVSAEIEKGVAAVEDLANQLTNGGPSGPLSK